MNFSYRYKFVFVFVLLLAVALSGFADEQSAPKLTQPLRVAVAGTPPFAVENGTIPQGIAVEIWRDIAAHAGWASRFVEYASVPEALDALHQNKVDVVVGPVSISSKRAQSFQFTQPYFQSSLSILTSTSQPTTWQRMLPLFSKAFFMALGILILCLFVVGTLIWAVERHHENSDFPTDPLAGIPVGMWVAVVTMTTVGYGDVAPKTLLGRTIAAGWMLISVVAATSLVAGIASTLSISNASIWTIKTAEDLHDRSVAILNGSPSRKFVTHYGAKITAVNSLEEGYQLLKKRKVDAVVFDRPQMLYFLQQNYDPSVKVSTAHYQPQGYGFAFHLGSPLVRFTNIHLLQMEESGRVENIVRIWLGKNDE